MEAITRTTLFLLCTVLLCWGVAGAKGNLEEIVEDGSGDDDFVTTDQPHTTSNMTADRTNTTGNMTDDYLERIDTTNGNMTDDDESSDFVYPTNSTGSPPGPPTAALSTPALIGLCATIGAFLLIVIVFIVCKRRRVSDQRGNVSHGKNQAKLLEGDLLEANNGSTGSNKKSKKQEQKQQPAPQRHIFSKKSTTPKKLSSRRKKMNGGLNIADDEIAGSVDTANSDLSGHVNVLDSAIYSNNEPTYSAAEGQQTAAASAMQQGESEYGNASDDVAAEAGQQGEGDYGMVSDEPDLNQRHNTNSSSRSPQPSDYLQSTSYDETYGNSAE